MADGARQNVERAEKRKVEMGKAEIGNYGNLEGFTGRESGKWQNLE